MTVELLRVASSASGVQGTPANMDGGPVNIAIKATSFGTDGKVVLKASPNYDGSFPFITLEDKNTLSGLAEYSANTASVRLDSLPAGWQIRADLEISSGTATVLLVVMS